MYDAFKSKLIWVHWRTSNSRLQICTYIQPREDHMASKSGTPRCKRDTHLHPRRAVWAVHEMPLPAPPLKFRQTNHWRSAVFLKGIRKRGDDNSSLQQRKGLITTPRSLLPGLARRAAAGSLVFVTVLVWSTYSLGVRQKRNFVGYLLPYRRWRCLPLTVHCMH